MASWETTNITDFWYGIQLKNSYIRQSSNPLRTHKLIRSIPVKAGCPVWKTVSCTLKAKVFISNGHWRDELKHMTGKTYRDVFLQLLHVETGNVLIWHAKRIKHEAKRGQCCQTPIGYYMSFLFKPQHIIMSFGCKMSGFTHITCSFRGPNLPTCGCLGS